MLTGSSSFHLLHIRSTFISLETQSKPKPNVKTFNAFEQDLNDHICFSEKSYFAYFKDPSQTILRI